MTRAYGSAEECEAKMREMTGGERGCASPAEHERALFDVETLDAAWPVWMLRLGSMLGLHDWRRELLWWGLLAFVGFVLGFAVAARLF